MNIPGEHPGYDDGAFGDYGQDGTPGFEIVSLDQLLASEELEDAYKYNPDELPVSLPELLADETTQDPLAQVITAELFQMARGALTKRQWQTVLLHSGLVPGCPPLSFSQIARMLGVSPTTISDRHLSAVANLRRAIRQDLGE